MDSAESAGGRLGAVLSAPRSGLVPLGASGPWLATTPDLAKRVLTQPAHFDFPGDVSRSGDLSASRGETRSGHLLFAALSPDLVGLATATFAREWQSALDAHDLAAGGTPYDAMELLRLPVARSTTHAVLASADESVRHLVADQTLAWIDALAPVIAARRPPSRWSRRRRREEAARLRLDATLAELPDLDGTPAQVATMLAAGIQVPIAAGAWLLGWLADHPTGVVDPVHAVWETLRLTPPTWLTVRVATADVDLGGQHVRAGALVFVSPLLLGRLETLAPGAPDTLRDFDPDRWRDDSQRPGAWLPFGAGPHACPGRTLGLAQLVHLASWAVSRELTLCERVCIDQSRGIVPAPCRFTAAARSEPSS